MRLGITFLTQYLKDPEMLKESPALSQFLQEWTTLPTARLYWRYPVQAFESV